MEERSPLLRLRRLIGGPAGGLDCQGPNERGKWAALKKTKQSKKTMKSVRGRFPSLVPLNYAISRVNLTSFTVTPADWDVF